jgi:hypothetical protein
MRMATKFMSIIKIHVGIVVNTLRDSNGNELTFKDSDEYSCEYTRDSNGKELTFKDSHGLRIGFDIPEYTMEELVEKLGNFKLVK